MSYVVLARKHRPLVFDDMVGQEHVGRTLGNAIRQDRVHHAYLFAGARGLGKTTTARIFAKGLVCEQGPTATPCNECEQCVSVNEGRSVDVMEIDGASNNSVDNIRNLREQVHYLPQTARRKVYIIDEVHMLTTSAFNALLKTLEEPPDHVNFIFATTEPQKVIPTILSRVSRLDFRRVSPEEAIAHLENILEKEERSVDKGGLRLIARAAGGSVRDSLTLLDQVIAFADDPTKITEEETRRVLGQADRARISDLVGAVLTHDPDAVMAQFDELVTAGHDLTVLSLQLLEHMRDLTLAAVCRSNAVFKGATEAEVGTLREQAKKADPVTLSQMFDRFSRVVDRLPTSRVQRMLLEMGLLDLAHDEPLVPLEDIVARLESMNGNGGGTPPGGGGGGFSAPPGRGGPSRGQGPGQGRRADGAPAQPASFSAPAAPSAPAPAAPPAAEAPAFTPTSIPDFGARAQAQAQAAPAPVQAAPVQAAPVQAAPVQAAPAPVQAAPAPVQAAPTPVQAAPTPVQAAPTPEPAPAPAPAAPAPSPVTLSPEATPAPAPATSSREGLAFTPTSVPDFNAEPEPPAEPAPEPTPTEPAPALAPAPEPLAFTPTSVPDFSATEPPAAPEDSPQADSAPVPTPSSEPAPATPPAAEPLAFTPTSVPDFSAQADAPDESTPEAAAPTVPASPTTTEVEVPPPAPAAPEPLAFTPTSVPDFSAQTEAAEESSPTPAQETETGTTPSSDPAGEPSGESPQTAPPALGFAAPSPAVADEKPPGQAPGDTELMKGLWDLAKHAVEPPSPQRPPHEPPRAGSPSGAPTNPAAQGSGEASRCGPCSEPPPNPNAIDLELTPAFAAWEELVSRVREREEFVSAVLSQVGLVSFEGGCVEICAKKGSFPHIELTSSASIRSTLEQAARDHIGKPFTLKLVDDEPDLEGHPSIVLVNAYRKEQKQAEVEAAALGHGAIQNVLSTFNATLMATKPLE
ncbi:MAG: DNA polymerase III subunit gamma/tau [Nannocystales bacterium]